MVCLSSSKIGNFHAKTCRSVRKTCCTSRQPINVRHFAYRWDSELSHVITKYTVQIFLRKSQLQPVPIFSSQVKGIDGIVILCKKSAECDLDAWAEKIFKNSRLLKLFQSFSF